MNIKPGSNLTKVRKNNYAAILGTIYQQGPITRNQIASHLEVTLPTVTTTIKPLLEKGILKEVPLQEAECLLGRKAVAVDFEENSGYVIGIEWNLSGIVACITNLRGMLVGKLKKELNYTEKTYLDMLKETRYCVEKLFEMVKPDPEKMIGIGWATPGMVNAETGVLVQSTMTKNMWHNEQIRRDLEQMFQLPVCVENHVRVRAIGQDMFQRKKRPDIYLYYFMQAGISCCIMADGEPFGKGCYGAGDIGHMVMDIHGPVCICGKRGCLQALAGEHAICDKAKDLMKRGGAPILKEICADPEKPEISEMALAVDRGDEELKNALLPAVRYMGISIGNTVNLLNCRMIAIDCTLFNSEILKEYLKEVILENNVFRNELKLEIEFIKGNRYTGAQGACALAIQEYVINAQP